MSHTPSDESELIRKGPCTACGSSDANAMYDDGHSYCYSCQTHRKGENVSENVETEHRKVAGLITGGLHLPLNRRKITQETCKKWGYEICDYNGRKVQVANYIVDGRVIAQKVRSPGKKFHITGDAKAMKFFGQHMWNGGKMLIITEGEIDAMAVSQVQSHKWPVVSVHSGAQAAKKLVLQELEWLATFEKVVFMFDMDAPGIKAAKECAALLPPGTAAIATLPLKDAGEMLEEGKGADIISAMWNAAVYRPDGIIQGTDTWDAVDHELIVGDPYPWSGLTEKTFGLRKGEVVVFTAGSGIGKSQITREVAHSLFTLGRTIGVIALEESIQRTALGIMSLDIDVPLHLTREGVTQADMRNAWENTLGTGKFFLYDHWGSLESDNLLNKMRYMAVGCGCDYIVLDHVSIVVSGIGDGDERRMIDNLMTNLRSMAEETGVGILLVSHLKRPEGKSHEDGAVTSLGQLRGSAAIAQLSDMVIGLERNQQDEKNPDVTTLRVLKNRYAGVTGVAGYLKYERDTGRMVDCAEPSEDGGFQDETQEY